MYHTGKKDQLLPLSYVQRMVRKENWADLTSLAKHHLTKNHMMIQFLEENNKCSARKRCI